MSERGATCTGATGWGGTGRSGRGGNLHGEAESGRERGVRTVNEKKDRVSSWTIFCFTLVKSLHNSKFIGDSGRKRGV